MIKIYIGNAFDPKTVIVNPNKVLEDVFNENGIPVPAGSVVTVNSNRISQEDLRKTLTDLGVKEGFLVTYTQKLNGAY